MKTVSSPQSRIILAGIVLFVGLLCPAAYAQIPADAVPLEGAEKDKIIAEINAKWESQKTEIVTAEVRYKSATFLPGKYLKALTQKQIHDILMATRLDSAEDYLELIEKLTTLDREKDVPMQFGGDTRLVQDNPGGLLRCELNGANILQVIKDGLYMEHLKNGKTASVYNAGDSFIVPDAIESLRWVCPVPLGSAKSDDITSEYYVDKNSVYNIYTNAGFKGSLKIDRVSGLVLYHELRQSPTDHFCKEKYQLLPFQTSGNITFPKVVVDINYDASTKDKIATVLIKLIESAVFNKAIRKEEFQVAVPPQTTIADFRGDVHSPKTYTVNSEVSDILDFLKTAGDSALTKQSATIFHRWAAILSINGIVIALIIFMIRRRYYSKHV